MSLPEGLDLVKPDSRAQTLNLLIYGKPGVGKTTFLGTAEDDVRSRDVMLVDIEGGVLSIGHRGKHLDIAPMKPGVISRVYTHLNEDEHNYKTVCLDTVTELQKFAMAQIMNDVTASKPDRDADMPQLQEWGKCIEQVRRIIRMYRDLPVHFIATAHEQDVKDERSGEITCGPSLPGKLALELPGFFDIVGRLYTTTTKNEKTNEMQIERRLMVQPTGKYIAKDRSGKLGFELINPTIPMMLDLIYGPQKAATAAPAKKG